MKHLADCNGARKRNEIAGCVLKGGESDTEYRIMTLQKSIAGPQLGARGERQGEAPIGGRRRRLAKPCQETVEGCQGTRRAEEVRQVLLSSAPPAPGTKGHSARSKGNLFQR